ncbi:MAG TPA: aldose epimerase family protein [Hanamia sp.]|nr:aldose epimerase family protein [Hanamia sp.]
MKFVKLTLFAGAFVTLIASCNNGSENKSTVIKPGVTKTDWGTVDGKNVYLYTLVNDKGDTVTITNYGGTVTSFVTPDKNGKYSSIIIGFDSLAPYLQHPPYFGALIGRYGNRIGDAKFTLDGTVYHLAANDGKNSLHGGIKGFDKVVWDATIPNDTVPSLTLKYLSKDGEEGYPGNLNVTVQYTLTNDDGLKIDYSAVTDKATPVNLTNHSYFNLSGDVSNSILDETMMIDADNYTPVDSTLIPTGEIKPVKGTPFDFTTLKKIRKDFADVKGGYDINFVLNRKDSSLQKVASVSDSISGRTMDIYTTQPGFQFYTGNFLDGTFKNRGDQPLTIHSAMALETQHFPDSPNKPNFPSTILRPGEKYHEVTIYQVSVK